MAHILAHVEYLVRQYVRSKYGHDDDALRSLTIIELDEELRNEDNDAHYDLKEEIFRTVMNAVDTWRVLKDEQDNLPAVDEEDGQLTDDSC
jgi:hypothetical protein